MKREILFRGKSIDNNEWLEGYYVGDNTLVKTEDMMYDLGYIDVSRCHECYSESIGQFTGLTDKNGKKIFEGDILRSTFEYDGKKREIIGVVEDDNCNPCFVIHYKYEGNGFDCYEYDFVQCGLRTNEVIGNIYDNKELLK